MSKRRFWPLGALVVAFAVTLPASAGAALRAPAPTSPASGADVPSAPPLLWSAVRGADRYEIQVAADRDFGSPLSGLTSGRRNGLTRNTAAALDTDLADGEYWWRVRAVDAKDRTGPWSSARSFTKAWTTPPELLAPDEGASISWPAQPLLLRWSPVPYATRYIVTLATDPGLASPVLGVSRDPVTTRGRQFALPGTLAPGAYYWAVTPLDESGHRGKRSAIRKVTWTWPTSTATRVSDVNEQPAVFDPLFAWDPVPGAASYEVEVNASQDWAPGSKVCCTDPTVGTSLSPATILRSNVYHWRVRAVDASGNAGVWNVGPTFQKDFDPAVPSIPGLRLRDRVDGPLSGTPPATDSPIITWDPVPGASSYTVQTVAHQVGGCDFSTLSPLDGQLVPSQDVTAATAYTYGRGTPAYNVDGPILGSVFDAGWNGSELVAGVRYCVRVRARSDRVGLEGDNGFVSDWTYLGGTNQPAFEFAASPAPGGGTPAPLTASDYLTPADGTRTERLPLFTWKPIADAAGYWVVVARDASFTTIADYHYTRLPQYAPGSGSGGSTGDITTYSDETTQYWWAVVPAKNADGSGVFSTPAQNAPRSFNKSSAPPARLAPAPNADVTAQPTFRWATSEGARRYRVQVAQDPTFGDPIDDVETASTAYTSSTTYPADTQLYWRVGAKDENGVRLNWSETGTFVRRLPSPAPAPGNPAGGEEIPALAWTPVAGAVSYDVHADWVDGKTSDITVSSTAFTPVEFYGNGVWRWKVRANFPTRSGRGSVSGGYFPAQTFVRGMSRTPNARSAVTRTQVLLHWDPDPAAVGYRVEISPTSGFGQATETFRPRTTAVAPTLDGPAFTAGGTLYWRVASVDGGRNQGAWTTGTFRVPRGLRVRAAGLLRRGKPGRIAVTVLDTRGLAVRGAKVRVTARGMRGRSRRTGVQGRAVVPVRPRRAGTVTVTVTRSGYRDATATVPVG